MRGPLILLSLLTMVPVFAETPVTLPNPSFESGTVEDLQGWTVSAYEGGQFKLSLH
jgi:hypothetical protein